MTDRQYEIPTGPGMGRSLVNHDDESKNFRAVDLLDDHRDQLVSRAWRRGHAYDQDDTPQCVAFTGKGILNTAALSANLPYRQRSRIDAADLYGGAQDNDQWIGRNYEGTSALGLCRYLQQKGLIREYRWCFGLDEVLRTLSWIGPVGIGVNWLEDMRDPDFGGYLHAAGDAIGGHEVELTAIDVHRRRVTVTNSWGEGWGQNGRAFLSFEDLGKILDDDGDAVVLVS